MRLNAFCQVSRQSVGYSPRSDIRASQAEALVDKEVRDYIMFLGLLPASLA